MRRVDKGEACSALGTSTLMEICRTAFDELGEGFKASRIDLAWDDYSKAIAPHELREEFWDPIENKKREQAICRAKRARFHEDDPIGSGCSYYIGSNSSDRMLRLYDKNAESGGKIDAMRFELQNRRDAATAVLRDLVKAEGELVGVAFSHLVGFLDFRDPDSYRSHTERRQRYEFWLRFVGQAGKATIGKPMLPDVGVWVDRYLRQNGGGFEVLREPHRDTPASSYLNPARVQRFRSLA